ncbi:hypothetical protein V6N12_065083 [Hibiscus sabdariffa]|uniref:MLO-like protein n=1 Tax=Hibiscus sabdariffa TaxID=183260 RepID=A0ABR2G8L9_9ROSI
MSGGGASGRELDQTPTWAVAVVCAVIIIISIALEKVLHTVGEIFEHKKKEALYEALEKVKGELMVLGFISLLLTFGQSYISQICIPDEVADTMLFCSKKHPHGEGHGEGEGHGNQEEGSGHGAQAEGEEHHRRLLFYDDARRFLSGAESSAACGKGYVPLISVHALHQLHIFIFFLAVFHVLYSATTMMLGRLKVATLHFLKIPPPFRENQTVPESLIIYPLQTRGWKEWERECINSLNELNDPSRFRLTHETSFVRDHTRGAWTKTKFSFYFVCLWRQFFRSVRKADYCTMRHGFVSSGIMGYGSALSPFGCPWLAYYDCHRHDSSGVGTKLQAIIAQMALEIVEKHAVIQGMPLVQVSDEHFWFGWPPLVLHLLHFVLFQSASPIHLQLHHTSTLCPCYSGKSSSLVAIPMVDKFWFLHVLDCLLDLQMGSTMKRSIFDEQTSKALKQWHKKAAQKTGDHGHGKTEASGHHKKENGADSSSMEHGHSSSGDAGHQDPNAEGKQQSNTTASLPIQRLQQGAKLELRTALGIGIGIGIDPKNRSSIHLQLL